MRGSTWCVPDPDYPDDTMPASRTTLIDMVADTGTPSFYDFDDRWCHTVRIVKPMVGAPGDLLLIAPQPMPARRQRWPVGLSRDAGGASRPKPTPSCRGHGMASP